MVFGGNISFGRSKGKMPGNKEKQRRWGVDKHPIFAILKMDVLEMCVSLYIKKKDCFEQSVCWVK